MVNTRIKTTGPMYKLLDLTVRVVALALFLPLLPFWLRAMKKHAE